MHPLGDLNAVTVQGWKNILTNDREEISALWSSVVSQGYFGSPREDETAATFEEAIKRWRIDADAYIESAEPSLSLYQRCISAIFPRWSTSAQLVEAMKSRHLQAVVLTAAIEKTTKSRIDMGVVRRVAFGDFNDRGTSMIYRTMPSESTYTPLSLDDKIQIRENVTLYINFQNQGFPEALIETSLTNLPDWWKEGDVVVNEPSDQEVVPAIGAVNLELVLRKLARKLVAVHDLIETLPSTAEHIATARSLTHTIRDLMIMYTRRFLNEHTVGPTLMRYVDLTIPLLYATLCFMYEFKVSKLPETTLKATGKALLTHLEDLKDMCLKNEVERSAQEQYDEENRMFTEADITSTLDDDMYKVLESRREWRNAAEEAFKQDRQAALPERRKLEQELVYDRKKGAFSQDEVMEILITIGLRSIDVRSEPLLEPFQSGSYGLVLRTSEFSNLEVVIKLPRSGEGKIIKSFLQEARIWKRLRVGGRRTNVVRLRGYSKVGISEYPGLVSKYHSNGSLRRYLSKNTVSLVEKRNLAEDVARGVQRLHTFDICHGDIRADNVLVDDNHRALLTDFGLSTLVTDQEGEEHDKLTNLLWVAPELREHDPDVAPRRLTMPSDIYSFGCICFEIFTQNHSPPSRELQDAVRQSHILDRPASTRVRDQAQAQAAAPGLNSEAETEGIDRRVWQLICDCWNPEPAARPKAWRVVVALRDMRPQGGKS